MVLDMDDWFTVSPFFRRHPSGFFSRDSRPGRGMSISYEPVALPQELLDEVVSYMDFNTLKQARLTCRKMWQLTTPLIFQKISFQFSEESLKDLLKLSISPHLNKGVVHVSYYLGDQESVKEIRDEEEPPEEENVANENEKRWIKAQAYVAKREKEGKDKVGCLALLCAALRLLPALKRVDLINHVGCGDHEAQEGALAFEQLLWDLCFVPSKPDSLCLESDDECLTCQSGLLTPLYDELPKIPESVLYLKTLHLKFGSFTICESMVNYGQTLLSMFLESAKNLESLSLELPHAASDGYAIGHPVGLNDLLGTNRLGSLQTLRISGVINRDSRNRYPADSFHHFYKTSCSELKHLSLTNARLSTGTWQAVLKSIHHFPHRLETVELRDLQYAVVSTTKVIYTIKDFGELDFLVDYLCNRTDVIPWLEDQRWLQEEQISYDSSDDDNICNIWRQ